MGGTDCSNILSQPELPVSRQDNNWDVFSKLLFMPDMSNSKVSLQNLTS